MSRLYRLLDTHLQQPLSPAMLSQLLQALIDSHADCASRAARLTLSFELMLRTPALRSEGLSGWRAYPVHIAAQCRAGRTTIQLQIEVLYASTRPCSAALSRQLLSDAFVQQHAGRDTLPLRDVVQWLQDHGTYATPHSQRSVAQVRVELPADAQRLAIQQLVGLCEQALATPVQAAVRRPDEQAFARLNGANLMCVEDAARRLRKPLAEHYAAFHVAVRHLKACMPTTPSPKPAATTRCLARQPCEQTRCTANSQGGRHAWCTDTTRRLTSPRSECAPPSAPR